MIQKNLSVFFNISSIIIPFFSSERMKYCWIPQKSERFHRWKYLWFFLYFIKNKYNSSWKRNILDIWKCGWLEFWKISFIFSIFHQKRMKYLGKLKKQWKIRLKQNYDLRTQKKMIWFDWCDSTWYYFFNLFIFSSLHSLLFRKIFDLNTIDWKWWSVHLMILCDGEVHDNFIVEKSRE